MRLTYSIVRAAIFVIFIATAGRPITGCMKNPLLPKIDSTDTTLHRNQYDSAAFYVSILINIYNTSGVFNDTFSDDGSMKVYVVNGVVTIPSDSILNFPPIVFPESGQDGIYKATWIADQIGVCNITGAYGIAAPGDSSVSIILQQTGTVTPKWQLVALADGTTTYSGGESVPGWPPGFSFDPRKQSQDAFKLEQPGSYWDVWVYKDY
ncbi:MAG TPA: hypothetical protein VGR89_11585 [Puia sp.]|nr:hypothetical protein [Puia sp.]